MPTFGSIILFVLLKNIVLRGLKFVLFLASNKVSLDEE
jgi:hypothetical protein